MAISLRLVPGRAGEGSVPRAAARLGVTQSAVSHGLNKPAGHRRRSAFVKSGRGIVATAATPFAGGRAP
ncbi:LysR family transcriptional regulator [Pseudolabrys sp. FHR47]|uniref:helix-turn-helix domain-containing protein n=1 Tax=Pseudolabrys sp. FHR47 TaxID=2562284 RepID=UPI001FEE335F|nr:LysR family transcriptional regulator [Pseudolabrys sp. FHR47]